jgi:alpha-L-fucosidase
MPKCVHNKWSLLAAILLAAASLFAQAYEPVEPGETQAWYEDAKFGIFIHWGIYSVPGYAPVDHHPDVSRSLLEELWHIIKNGGETETAYAEWYKNNLAKTGMSTERYHREHYGEDFDYYDFAPMFNQAIQQWRPEEWAATFREIGAKYVVLVSKHHDGFTLWPSAYPSAHIPEGKATASRNIVGELSDAVRKQGLYMGLYYSGGIDWSYGASYDFSPLGRHDYPPDFIENTDKQLEELIAKYQPDILWNDISYPVESRVVSIVNDFRQQVPHGVINNRWREVPRSQVKPDFGTPEYATHDRIQPFKWETSRGLGYSYGYNRMDSEQTTLSRKELIHFLIDVVSKNGNLLLNIGPKADGSIPEIQLDRLKALGEWLAINGEAIYGTRPWDRAEGSTGDGIPIRFTHKKEQNRLYAILLQSPPLGELTIGNLSLAAGSHLRILGSPQQLAWQQRGNDILVDWPQNIPVSHAYAVEIEAAP